MPYKEDSKGRRIVSSGVRVILTSIVGFLMFFAAWSFYWPALFKWDFDNGLLGDSFGYWNSIFSGLALMGVVISIILQSQELKAQKEELRKTSEALNGQLEQQRKDNFEATFFRLLEIFQQVSSDVTCPNVIYMFRNKQAKQHYEDFVRGREAFAEASGMVTNAKTEWAEDIKEFKVLREFPYAHAADPQKHTLEQLCNLMYYEFSESFGQYYRLLFNLLELIDEAKFLDDQHRYAKIVRAGLGNPQVLLLGFNCASEDGRRQILPLVQKYRILKYFPEEYFYSMKLDTVYDESQFAFSEHYTSTQQK